MATALSKRKEEKLFIVKKVNKIYARILIFIDGWFERDVNIASPLSMTFPLNLLLKCILCHIAAYRV